ncbi:ABC transporter substrate-binding protein [Holospora elegans]|uniref:ABC transporter substrate-binding protein n=1 Tax=Holospora elegans TaxID=431043 RepID=UPI00139F2A4E|nr:ABC transporter substrate-binding protein [Holospora elegans]
MKASEIKKKNSSVTQKTLMSLSDIKTGDLNFFSSLNLDSVSLDDFEEGTNFNGYHVNSDPHFHTLVNIKAPKGGILRLSTVSPSVISLNPFVSLNFPPGIFSVHEPNSAVASLMMRCWRCAFHMIPYCSNKIRKAKDNSWITFYLDPKAKFHDGTPITAQDVLATFEYFLRYGSFYRKKLGEKVKSILVQDSQTITFYMKPIKESAQFGLGYEPDFPLVLAGLPILSKADISWRNGNEDSMTPLTGSGPYRLCRHTDTITIYERVKDFWGKDLPQFQGISNADEIQYKRFITKESAFSAFLRKEIDLWKEDNPEQWDLYFYSANFENKIRIHTVNHKQPVGMKGFFFNAQLPLFKDIRLRQGISAIFDLKFSDFRRIVGKRARRIQSFFQGTPYACLNALTLQEQKALLGLPVPITQIATPKLQNKREILNHFKRAGWSLKNQILQKNNTPMRFVIITKKKEEKVWAERFSIYLKDFGIEALVKEVDETAYYQKISKKDFDIIVAERRGTLSPGAEQISYWTSEHAGPQGKNYSGIQDPNIDFACKQIMVFWNDQEKYTLWLRILDHLLKLGCYVLPLHYYDTKIIAHWRRVEVPKPVDYFFNFSSETSCWISPK